MTALRIWKSMQDPSSFVIANTLDAAPGTLKRIKYGAAFPAASVAFVPAPGEAFQDLGPDAQVILACAIDVTTQTMAGISPQVAASQIVGQFPALKGAALVAADLGKWVKDDGTNTGTVILVSAQTDKPLGVLTAIPDPTVTGSQVEVTCFGIARVKNSGGVTVMDRITFTAAGLGITMAGTDFATSAGASPNPITGTRFAAIALETKATTLLGRMQVFPPSMSLA
jgi:hypothetical protein